MTTPEHRTGSKPTTRLPAAANMFWLHAILGHRHSNQIEPPESTRWRYVFSTGRGRVGRRTCLDLAGVSVTGNLGVVLAAALDVSDAEVEQHLLDRLLGRTKGKSSCHKGGRKYTHTHTHAQATTFMGTAVQGQGGMRVLGWLVV